MTSTTPAFRLRTRHGGEHVVEAHRLRADTAFLYAVICADGAWRPVLRLPLDEVTEALRRLDQHLLDQRRGRFLRPHAAGGG